MVLLLLFTEASDSLKVNSYLFKPLLSDGALVTLLQVRLPLYRKFKSFIYNINNQRIGLVAALTKKILFGNFM